MMFFYSLRVANFILQFAYFFRKKKIKILVKGDIIPRFEVLQKTIFIEDEIRNGLKEFLGLENSVLFKGKVNAIEPRDKKCKRVL